MFVVKCKFADDVRLRLQSPREITFIEDRSPYQQSQSEPVNKPSSAVTMCNRLQTGADLVANRIGRRTISGNCNFEQLKADL